MMGQFNVYLNDDKNTSTLLLQKVASQGVNDWTNVQMTFNPEGPYQVINNVGTLLSVDSWLIVECDLKV